MILHRCFARDRAIDPDEPGGPLWYARAYQGTGRHDNPEHYGCLYVSADEKAAIAEVLAPLRGTGTLTRAMLLRRGLPLAAAAIDVADDAELLDLDDPVVLAAERLRPSRVATRDRTVTQPQALELWQRHTGIAGIAWWSTLEAAWRNVTLFDRARPALSLADVRDLALDDAAVAAACEALGLVPAV